MDDDKTRLSYWFPLLHGTGLPLPRTEIIRLSAPDAEALAGIMDGSQDVPALGMLVAAIQRAALAVSGSAFDPFFLRTDFTSGKHSWPTTCYVADRSVIPQHIYNLCEYSALADIVGLPTDVWVVRELLQTRPVFHAFDGMPVTREFRFFVRDATLSATGRSEVVHVQPYWPPDSIEDYEPDAWDWRDKLVGISMLSDAERQVLVAATERVADACPGYWSVDWLQTERGEWKLIDMAEGEKSLRWDGGL